MNCKPGDLAVVIRSKCSDHIGMLVTVVGPALIPELGMWTIEPVKPIPCPSPFGWKCRDSSLRPIRDQPGQDETLTWAPVPAVKEGVPA